ncbi:hypothetical protein B0J13DRAFT_239004 [Dactylonectria estremocensis]|uniref:NACHT domain-containing protein n=1 Tax=Dactylonectria estremocensis TaxID=1079267 RepID=A0A9P9D6X2_9HYPO|nr:hypothetical protein B0J13DRAFT_239004 [Dactylonectria estremocensis]
MLFTQLLHVVPACTFVVDGLDECTYLDNSSTSVTRFLRTVTDTVVGTNTRVLVVSRAEPEIRQALKLCRIRDFTRISRVLNIEVQDGAGSLGIRGDIPEDERLRAEDRRFPRSIPSSGGKVSQTCRKALVALQIT